ncbi:unnamed protein product, partial [marine sediment metagenome]
LKLARRNIRLRSGRDVNIMESIKVSEVVESDYEAIRDITPLRQVFSIMQSSKSSFFPIVDYKGHIVGTLSFQDMRTMILDKPEVDALVIAQDICHPHPPSLYPDDSLDKALQKLALRDLEFLPVVARDEPQKLIGILKKSDIFRQYHRKLLDKMSQS